METKQAHFIGGDWIAGGSEQFQSTSPVDDSVLWEGLAADAALIDQAVSSARTKFADWSELSFAERQTYVTRFVDYILCKLPTRNKFAAETLYTSIV